MPVKGRSRYTDAARYVAVVLYLHGYSLAEVAALLHRYGLTHRISRQSVESIMRSAGIKKSAPRAERQAILDHLKTQRLDGGILREYVFHVL